ncbi:CC103 protein, partial [Bucco capensis]|nr:CC103 protein [Bucco capensis]
MEAADGLDVAALEQELQAALAADERHERENKAKLQALHQRVSSYEEFSLSAITACAKHISAIQRLDGGGMDKTLQVGLDQKALGNCFSPQELAQLPRNSAEFCRAWRRGLGSRKAKYQFLLGLGGEALARIFQADLGFGLLGEFLRVLAEHVSLEDRAAVLQILQSLSGTQRFGLNIDLLSKVEKESSRDLFGKLWSTARDGWNAGHHGSPAHWEVGREAQLMDSSLQKEAEEERLLLELMKCYQ